MEPELERLAGEIAGKMFGAAWKADEGVIRFGGSAGHLRKEIAGMREGNPWAEFFMRKNPGCAGGDELVCLTEMAEGNLRKFARAAFPEDFRGTVKPGTCWVFSADFRQGAARRGIGCGWIWKSEVARNSGRRMGFPKSAARGISARWCRSVITVGIVVGWRGSQREGKHPGLRGGNRVREDIGQRWRGEADPGDGGSARGLRVGDGGVLEGWRRDCPEVFDGRACWALPPPGIPGGVTAGGLPVGMDSDGAYFPERIGAALGEWLVVPELSGSTVDVFRETAEKLLETADLSMVSVWSPAFRLGIDSEISRLGPGKTWRELCPKLALVSCWADAASARWIPVVEGRIGGIRIEPKGLLATEGITTIPVSGKARLAHECHYHEFLDMEGNHLPQENLRAGMECEVLLTTSGGLMRYRSGDTVRITGFDPGGIPQMRFLGRKGMVCDLVGEKFPRNPWRKRSGVRGFSSPPMPLCRGTGFGWRKRNWPPGCSGVCRRIRISGRPWNWGSSHLSKYGACGMAGRRRFRWRSPGGKAAGSAM